MNKFYVIKETNTFSDTLECIGLADLLKKISNRLTDDDFLDTIIHKYNYNINPVSSPNPEAKTIRDQKRVVWRDKMRPIEKYFFYKISGRLLHQLNYSADNKRWWYKSAFQRFIVTVAYPIFSFSYYGGKLIKTIQKKNKRRKRITSISTEIHEMVRYF
jgi:hypothetical protein